MKQTSRIRVLSDKIPRALVFIYFCRGLSGNMERRPTCHVYNEIIMCRAIFLNLEESRSHGNERETGRARGQGARPPPLGARPGLDSNQKSFHGPSSTDLKIKENHAINVGLIQWPKFTWKDYITKASPPLGERREEEKSLSNVAIKVRV